MNECDTVRGGSRERSSLWKKEINQQEYTIIQHILKNDASIIPHVYEITPEYIVYEEYAMTYEDSSHNPEYDDIIKKLITRLHNIGIVHCDLHSSNIVLNEMNEMNEINVRLIDFGESYFIKEVDHNIINNVANNFEEDSINGLEKLLEFDFIAYKR